MMARVTIYQNGKAVGGIQIEMPPPGKTKRVRLQDDNKTVIHLMTIRTVEP